MRVKNTIGKERVTITALEMSAKCIFRFEMTIPVQQETLTCLEVVCNEVQNNPPPLPAPSTSFLLLPEC